MKKYMKPEIEISVFATEDVITTSTVGGTEDEETTTVSLTNGGALDDGSAGTAYSDIF
ncbi:MAG: hypothetical protein IJ416_11015 [Ruminiclostridium sp.]|nr:hypothetical protein [Ruminiclostridium sp.]